VKTDSQKRFEEISGGCPRAILVAAELGGDTVENAAPQPRAHGTVRVSSASGVVVTSRCGPLDAVSRTQILEVALQDVALKRIPLVDRDATSSNFTGARRRNWSAGEALAYESCRRHGAQDPIAVLDQTESWIALPTPPVRGFSLLRGARRAGAAVRLGNFDLQKRRPCSCLREGAGIRGTLARSLYSGSWSERTPAG